MGYVMLGMASFTPQGINGADWAAERAWMLVRMGEADAARQLEHVNRQLDEYIRAGSISRA